MKAKELINDVMSEWRTVRRAPDLAHELFDHLDPDEVQRLAMAGFTQEIGKMLRKKGSNGVPVYSNIDSIDTTGKKVRQYKQTAAFSVEDFELAVGSYTTRAESNFRVAHALMKACASKFGVQLTLGKGVAS